VRSATCPRADQRERAHILTLLHPANKALEDLLDLDGAFISAHEPSRLRSEPAFGGGIWKPAACTMHSTRGRASTLGAMALRSALEQLDTMTAADL
jgi:hypothetical protein